MKPQWILVANGSIARLFQRAAAGDPLVALDVIDFPSGRARESDSGPDRPGHERSDHSSAAARFEPRTDARHKHLHQWARELARHLDAGLNGGAYGALWVVASSPLLGELRAALGPAVAERVRAMHEADLTGLDLAALEARLRALPA